MDVSIEHAILKKVRIQDNKKILSCFDAFNLAEQFSINIAEIGQFCGTEGIKINHCQLGCF